MEDKISDNEIDEAFKPKSWKEKHMADKIKKDEKIYGKSFYTKPERRSLKVLNYHIRRIKEGKSIRYDMEEVYLDVDTIIAICDKEGINYKLGTRNGNKCILYIGGV